MKKTIAILITIIVLSLALMVSASAAGYRGPAEQLNRLGLFRGTDTGFSLERAPTRAEAVTMLVRLLGLEETAENGSFSHPFTDLVEWQVPYVSLAYEMGLTTGTSTTTFTPGGACTAQMYVTFVARALGYTDNDVQSTLWAEALIFGRNIGILDDTLNATPFLRGHMVAVSYLALYVPTSDGAFDTLLAKLVSDGAVSSSAAATAVSYLNLINEFNQVGASFANERSIDLSLKLDMDVVLLGTEMTLSSTMETAIIIAGSDVKRAIKYDAPVPMADRSLTGEIYFTDGFAYVNARGMKTKTSASATSGISDELLAVNDVVRALAYSTNPIYSICSITKGTQSGLTVYTYALSTDNIQSLIDIIVGMMSATPELAPDEFSGELKGELNGYIYVNAAGEIVRMTFVFDTIMKIDGLPMDSGVELDIDINAIGSSVSITFPADLNQYQ
ncbi:MAG: S-layer homology domain-containing protein [Oscillospiraceae bacterium]|nr:S-layer homology domain-containing protein [Oscillospiraceae bacterium]